MVAVVWTAVEVENGHPNKGGRGQHNSCVHLRTTVGQPRLLFGSGVAATHSGHRLSKAAAASLEACVALCDVSYIVADLAVV